MYVGLFLLAVFLVYLAVSLLGGTPFGFYYRGRALENDPSQIIGTGEIHTCPLCGHILVKGQRLKSVVFQGGTEAGGVKEQVAHLLGCPYCFPPNQDHPRKCLVCGAKLPAEGYLVARFFTRRGRRRKHVHVLGCTECRKQRKMSSPKSMRP